MRPYLLPEISHNLWELSAEPTRIEQMMAIGSDALYVSFQHYLNHFPGRDTQQSLQPFILVAL